MSTRWRTTGYTPLHSVADSTEDEREWQFLYTATVFANAEPVGGVKQGRSRADYDPVGAVEALLDAGADWSIKSECLYLYSPVVQGYGMES